MVVPVADASRNRLLADLLESLKKQTLRDFEVILVEGDSRQGRAINQGVRVARGEWIVTMDDDTMILDDDLLACLVARMEEAPEIGLGGAACVIPDSASAFQKRAMLEVPRRQFPVQESTVDSDFVQHPCLIIQRDLFMAIGGEDEELVRGLDPVLRKKVRDRGKRVAILAGTRVAHLVPDSLGALVRMYRRNGRGSAFASRFFPGRVLELTDGFDGGSFVETRPLGYRVQRRMRGFMADLWHGRWLSLSCQAGYVTGWVEGFLEGGFPGSSPRVYGEPSSPEGQPPVRRLRAVVGPPSTDEQIARMHVNPTRDFCMGSETSPVLDFYRDKVGLFRQFEPQGVLVEQNASGEVLGFLLLNIHPGKFKKRLLMSAYPLRYLWSLVTRRYKGSREGWRKWWRLPLAFIRKPKGAPGSGGAKVLAFIVREDQRGQGIGSALLRRAESETLRRGKHHLEVTVAKDNAKAIRVYEKEGYKITGELLESTGQSYYLEKPVGVP
ncbi:MAG: GNAT family N-acetyltransferase [Planctomycetota bacterium]